uniref:Odorant receptor n=1 Tax=Anoplophora chinensis TaxID=217632 RepID=A0A2H4ZB70_ANOCN|nr:odorant receptor [Anoplophora chinensis]
MDTLFMNILNSIGFNLKMVQGAFLTIRNRIIKQTGKSIYKSSILLDSEELKLKLCNEMKKICHHLQIIYKVCEDLENVHKYLTLAQMTATLFILCSCLYLVSSTPITSKQFYAEIVYMVAMGFQLTLYCWFGNEVTLKVKTYNCTFRKSLQS